METDRIEIRTPEGLDLEMTLAGLGSRATAAIIDTTIIVLLAILVLLPLDDTGSFAMRIVQIVLPIVLFFGYHMVFETVGRRQAPGKRLLRLRVVSADGSPASGVSTLVRNLIRIVDFLPGFYLIGAIAVFSTTQNQRLGDLAAGVVVVMEPRPIDDPPALLLPASQLPEGWDVSAVTDEDIAVMREFLNRREKLTPDTSRQIGYQIASAIEAKVSRPPQRMLSSELIETVLQLKDARD